MYRIGKKRRERKGKPRMGQPKQEILLQRRQMVEPSMRKGL